ncbi:MAG: hypothetical protein QM296_09955 [Bacillota bacterium]|nr:hypothetical protein [Bacillota bacterium]
MSTQKEQNIYRRARKTAAERDERLASIWSAAEVIGCHERTLGDYETWVNRPPVETVVRLAEVYRAPELLPQYCAEECPIGRARGLKSVIGLDICQTALQALHTLQSAEDMGKSLLAVVQDGRIDEHEEETVKEIVGWIDHLASIGEELKRSLRSK